MGDLQPGRETDECVLRAMGKGWVADSHPAYSTDPALIPEMMRFVRTHCGNCSLWHGIVSDVASDVVYAEAGNNGAYEPPDFCAFAATGNLALCALILACSQSAIETYQSDSNEGGA